MIRERNYDVGSFPSQAPLKLRWPFRFCQLGKRNKPFNPPHPPVIGSRLFPKGSTTMAEATPKRADSSWLSASYSASCCGNVSFIQKGPLGRKAHCPLHYFCLFSWIRNVTSELARKPQ